MNWRRIAFLIVLAPAAAFASATALAGLAQATGWGQRASWLLPISLDVLAAFAVVEWASSKTRDVAREYARILAIGALAVSVAGNAVAHLVSAGIVEPGWVLVVLVGAIPPAALAAAVHLAVLASAPVQSRRPSRRPAAQAAASADEMVPGPGPVIDPRPEPKRTPLRSVPSGNDEDRVRAILAEHGANLSRARAQKLLRERYGAGMNNRRLQELLNAAKVA